MGQMIFGHKRQRQKSSLQWFKGGNFSLPLRKNPTSPLTVWIGGAGGDALIVLDG